MTGYRDAGTFLLLAVVWGLSFPAIEVALPSLPPLLLAALRFDLSGTLLLAGAVLAADDWRPSGRPDLLAVAGGGVFFVAIGNGVWFLGQQLTTSALSGLMTSLIPVLTAVCSWVLLPRDRLSTVGVVGLAVAFGGALLIVIPDDAALFGAGLVGKSYMLAGAVATALGSVIVRRADPPMSSIAVTAWSMLLGAALLHVFAPVAGEPVVPPAVPPVAVAALLYLGIVSSALAYWLYFGLLTRRSAVELNLVTYLVPVVAAAAGWYLFGERLSPSMIGGFGLVVVGFALLKRRAIRDVLSRHRIADRG